MDPNIGLATLADVDELARLRWLLYTQQRPTPTVSPTATTLTGSPAFAREALADLRWRAWIAEDMGQLVGALWRFTVPRVPQPGRGEPRRWPNATNVHVNPRNRLRRARSEAARARGRGQRAGRDAPS